MNKPGFALVLILAGCMGNAPAAFAKRRHQKTQPHVEFTGLINDGQPIRIDSIPERLPDFTYSSYNIPLTEEQ